MNELNDLKKPTSADVEEKDVNNVHEIDEVKNEKTEQQTSMERIIDRIESIDEINELWINSADIRVKQWFVDALKKKTSAVIDKEITTLEEADAMLKQYPDLFDVDWFLDITATRKAKIKYQGYEDRVKQNLNNAKLKARFQDKRAGYVQMIKTDRREIIFGYGEIVANTSIKILIFYSSSQYLVPGKYYILPAHLWEMCFAGAGNTNQNAEEEFIEWLATNDYRTEMMNIERQNEELKEAEKAKESTEKTLTENKNLKLYQDKLEQSLQDKDEEITRLKKRPIRTWLWNFLKPNDNHSTSDIQNILNAGQ